MFLNRNLIFGKKGKIIFLSSVAIIVYSPWAQDVLVYVQFTSFVQKVIKIFHQNKDLLNLRSIHRWCSVRKGVLRNFTKFTGKHLWQKKEETLARCFAMNFVKFLSTPFCIEHLWWLLFELVNIWCFIYDLRNYLGTRFTIHLIKSSKW